MPKDSMFYATLEEAIDAAREEIGRASCRERV